MKCIATIFMISALILSGCNNQEINKVSVLPSNLVPLKDRYGPCLKILCWIGLCFLILFSLLFVGNSFLGIGIN